jgi:hypothetical protein
MCFLLYGSVFERQSLALNSPLSHVRARKTLWVAEPAACRQVAPARSTARSSAAAARPKPRGRPTAGRGGAAGCGTPATGCRAGLLHPPPAAQRSRGPPFQAARCPWRCCMVAAGRVARGMGEPAAGCSAPVASCSKPRVRPAEGLRGGGGPGRQARSLRAERSHGQLPTPRRAGAHPSLTRTVTDS